MTTFEKFWNIYPVKVAKGAALKSWDKVMATGLDPEVIFRSLDMQKRYRLECEKAKTFVPRWKHPATWLNQMCWEDEVGSVAAIREAAKEKVCACGKPSMFGANVPLNDCQECYMVRVAK